MKYWRIMKTPNAPPIPKICGTIKAKWLFVNRNCARPKNVGTVRTSTGTFVTDGFGFTATAGLVAPNPALAAVFGAIVMSLEALSLLLIAKLFDKFPGVKKSADSMRVSMTKLLEIALLAGFVVAAGNMAGGLGYFVVAAFYAMNEYFKKPITRLAVGPIATIFVALLVNLFSVIGLFAV